MNEVQKWHSFLTVPYFSAMHTSLKLKNRVFIGERAAHEFTGIALLPTSTLFFIDKLKTALILEKTLSENNILNKRIGTWALGFCRKRIIIAALCKNVCTFKLKSLSKNNRSILMNTRREHYSLYLA